MSAAGTFRDVDGRQVWLPEPTHADQEAIADFRSQLNAQLAPEVVLERIRKHTALIADARGTADG